MHRKGLTGLPIVPGKILSRPAMSSPTTPFLSSQGNSSDLRGLPLPPPRRIKAKDDSSRTSHYRTPFFKWPSLNTFGSQASMGGRYTAPSVGEPFNTESSVERPNTSDSIEHVAMPREGFRSETPGSSRTFGRPSTARR